MGEINDDKFENTIKKILEDKMAASSMDINVESKDGNIHLSGVVDVLGEKLAAEKIVKHINGVRAVENNITISTDGHIPDSDLETYVSDKLQTENLGHLTPKVEGGVVTLYGNVENYEQEKNALELASQARGAIDIVSKIKNETVGTLDDSQIRSSVTQVLRENGLDPKDIDTIVKDRNVVLEGFVERKDMVELAEELVCKLDGVKKVSNRLMVQRK